MKDIGRSRRKPKKKRFIEIPFEVPAATPGPIPAIGGGGVHTFFPIPIELDQVGKMLLANSAFHPPPCYKVDMLTA